MPDERTTVPRHWTSTCAALSGRLTRIPPTTRASRPSWACRCRRRSCTGASATATGRYGRRCAGSPRATEARSGCCSRATWAATPSTSAGRGRAPLRAAACGAASTAMRSSSRATPPRREPRSVSGRTARSSAGPRKVSSTWKAPRCRPDSTGTCPTGATACITCRRSTRSRARSSAGRCVASSRWTSCGWTGSSTPTTSSSASAPKSPGTPGRPGTPTGASTGATSCSATASSGSPSSTTRPGG